MVRYLLKRREWIATPPSRSSKYHCGRRDPRVSHSEWGRDGEGTSLLIIATVLVKADDGRVVGAREVHDGAGGDIGEDVGPAWDGEAHPGARDGGSPLRQK